MAKKRNPLLEDYFGTDKFPSPKEIKSYLDKRVIGQDEAKKRIAVAVYNHYKRVLSGLNINNGWNIKSDDYDEVEIGKSNIILSGDTGTGKTFLIQNVAEMLGVPCHIHDCTKLTQAGYAGEDVENILTGLLKKCFNAVHLAEIGIVCLDEIDKIAMKGDTRDSSGLGVQQDLLKMVEGDVVGVMPTGGRKHPEEELIRVDTSDILFIGLGAFVGLDKIVERRLNANNKSIGFNRNDLAKTESNGATSYLDMVIPEDLKKFGFIPEFVGRFPIFTHTNPLHKEDLVRIIAQPRNAILKQYEKLFKLDGKNLIISDDAIDAIAEMAIASGTGARGLRNVFETLLMDYMYDGKNGRRKNYVVDRKYCMDRLEQILVGSNKKTLPVSTISSKKIVV